MAKKKIREIPAKNSIELFFHCAQCLKEKPINQSPRDWVRLEAGWTKLGLQIVCVRCGRNVIHIDFEGQKHRANMASGVEGE